MQQRIQQRRMQQSSVERSTRKLGNKKKILSERFKHSLSTRRNTNRSDRIFPEPWELSHGHLLSFLGHIHSSLNSSSHSLSPSAAKFWGHLHTSQKQSKCFWTSLYTSPTSRWEHQPTKFAAEILLCLCFLCKSTTEIFNNFPLLQGVILQTILCWRCHLWEHKLLYDKGEEKSVFTFKK